MSAPKIKIGFFVALIFFFLPTPKIVFADSFVKDSYPVFTSDMGGSWEINSVANPNVLYHEGKFKMWYGANSNFKWAIGYATSINGKTDWETIETPIITSYPLEGWDEMEIGHPSVVYTEEKKYEMWFIGTSTRWQGGNDRFRVKYATSQDGINWTLHPKYVLKGDEYEWDNGGMGRGLSVILTPKGYEMWYGGIDGSNSNWRIGYASSSDGISWTKHSTPVVTPEELWELSWLSYPEVFYDGSIYYMFYVAAAINTGEHVVYAYSIDGIHWIKPNNGINPILTINPYSSFDNTCIVTPSFIKNGNLFKIWYAGFNNTRWAIGYAEGTIPLPIPTPLQPLVFLPGLGGSWNHENMILGIEKSQPEWYLTPGVKVYAGLIQTFKNAGYQTDGPDKNLFIFTYNWTKPVSQIAEDLKNYLQTVVNPPPGTKIDLVGHSLGGLTARTYVQNNPDNPVDQLLTLGSPHKGAAQVYYAWSAGNLHFLDPIERIAAGLLVYLRKTGFSTNKQTIQTIVPVLKDLLPTFNYLKQNSWEKPVNEMAEKNDWLINFNISPPAHLFPVFTTLFSNIPQSTLRWIQVQERNWLDRILGFWPDGKPTGNTEFDTGDKTVLSESAQLNGANIVELSDLNHREIVETLAGQQKIMEILGLSPSSISTISEGILYEPALVFQLASPAILTILGPDSTPVGEGDGKLVVVAGAASGEYQAKITGTSNGKYDLLLGQITAGGDVWTTIAGSINSGQVIIHKFLFQPDSPLENPLIDPTGADYLQSSRIKIQNLKNEIKQKFLLFQLNYLLQLINKQKYEQAIIFAYQIRQQINFGGNDTCYLKNKIQAIINDLEQVYIIFENNKGGKYSSKLLNREITAAEKLFQKMEIKLKILESQGKTKPDYGTLYLLASEKLNQAKTSSSYEAHIKALGAKYLSQEGLSFFL